MTVETGDALEIIPRLEGEFDMVFLDAAKREYFNYLRYARIWIYCAQIIRFIFR